MRVKKIEFSFWKNSEMKKIMINNVIKRVNMHNCIFTRFIIHVKFLDGIHSKEVL